MAVGFRRSANGKGGNAMKTMIGAGLILALLSPELALAQASPSVGTAEFGLTPKQLVQAIDQVEQLISKCMHEEGFEYIAADHSTVQSAMAANKKLPGLSEQEFVSKFGFGVSTTYTGEPPQLASGYNPAKIGLGERNVQIFRSLSQADQVAYNRALFGGDFATPFAVAIETENFSQCGGCTRKAVEQVFKPEQVQASFYNPLDELVNKDPRMKAALRYYGNEMKKAGFDYTHPDQVEPDLRARLAAITNGSTVPIEKMSAEQRASLKRLQNYELGVATRSFKLQEEVLGPVEEKVQEEMFARKVP
jgi:hypothetical protein